jgi:hypothetical protein
LLFPDADPELTEVRMRSALLAALDWLKRNESVALWLEGIALILIFFWDRKDHREDHAEIINQMKVMSRNTLAAEAAVNAATKSADALINSERAWIDGELVRKDPLGIKRHVIKLTNHGKTPGRLLKYEVHYGPLTPGTPFSCERLDGYLSESLQGLIGSTATKELERLIDIDSLFSDTPPFELAALCITIRYGDVLTKDNSHKTSFVYHYESLVGLLKRMTEYDTYE